MAKSFPAIRISPPLRGLGQMRQFQKLVHFCLPTDSTSDAEGRSKKNVHCLIVVAITRHQQRLSIFFATAGWVKRVALVRTLIGPHKVALTANKWHAENSYCFHYHQARSKPHRFTRDHIKESHDDGGSNAANGLFIFMRLASVRYY